MKFLLDMPISQSTSRWLVSRGNDTVHARDIGLAKSPDEDILKQAGKEGRIVITMDLDFPAILALTHAARPGVILIRMRDPRPALVQECLNLLFTAYSESQLASAITVIEDFRIRIRKLPII